MIGRIPNHEPYLSYPAERRLSVLFFFCDEQFRLTRLLFQALEIGFTCLSPSAWDFSFVCVCVFVRVCVYVCM